MIDHRGVPAVARCSDMRGDTLIFIGCLDRAIAETHPDLGLQQGVGHREIVPVDLGVVIKPYLAAAPFRELV